MIGFNGTYLTEATHHGMRITAACLGGQWVMKPWLMTATAQAILAAFGAEEGMVVILRTNDYLNAIAATDHARALLLAGFINEDPMLVCSLVETSKTRWLVGDGVAYIDTDIAPSANCIFEVSMKVNVDATYCSNGCRIAYQNTMFANQVYIGSGQFAGAFFDVGANRILTGVMPTKGEGYKYKLDCLNKKAYVNDSEFAVNAFAGSTLPIFLFGTNNNGAMSNGGEQDIDFASIINGEDQHRYLPYNNGTESGMLDIISGTFHPNANTSGSFTIQITDKA